MAVFLTYARYISLPVSLAFLLLHMTSSAAQIGANFWLSAWSEDQVYNMTSQEQDQQTNMRLGVYGAIGVTQGM